MRCRMQSGLTLPLIAMPSSLTTFSEDSIALGELDYVDNKYELIKYLRSRGTSQCSIPISQAELLWS